MKLSDLVHEVSKKAVPAHQKNVIFEAVVEDAEENDVEVPYIMMKMPWRDGEDDAWCDLWLLWISGVVIRSMMGKEWNACMRF